MTQHWPSVASTNYSMGISYWCGAIPHFFSRENASKVRNLDFHLPCFILSATTAHRWCKAPRNIPPFQPIRSSNCRPPFLSSWCQVQIPNQDVQTNISGMEHVLTLLEPLTKFTLRVGINTAKSSSVRHSSDWISMSQIPWKYSISPGCCLRASKNSIHF